MSEQRPEKTGRRSGGVLTILAVLLLLAAAGGVGWLHLTGRLEQLLADSPSIEVELPATVAESAAPEPAPEAESPEPAPVAEPGIVPAPAEAPAAVEQAVPGHAAPVPAEAVPVPESSAGTAAEATAGTGQIGEVPPPETAPESATPEPTPPETTAPVPAPAGDQLAAAPPPPAPDTHEAAPAEAPAAEVPAVDEPPPPAPPAPELAPESPAEAPPAPEAAAEAQGGAESGEEVAPPEGEAPPESPLENPQVAAATVPPGTVPAWQRLARPFPDDETRPRIAVVVAGLGLSEAATTAAIQQLPAEITLSFSPYSNRIEEWVAAARAAGHEVLIDLPMEPASFPRDDPGPQALLTSLGAGANAERLAWVLGRVEGYVGVATFMGSRFTTSAEHMQPVLDELKRRGLLILDSRDAADSLTAKLAHDAGLAYVINDRFLDNEASRVAIDGRLQQIERIARTRGVAVAMGYAYPVTVERLTAWTRGLAGKGLALAPISAVAGRQEVR